MAETYVILEADSVVQLADVVNKAITQGWLPNGGFVAVEILGDYRWFQPMIEQTAAMSVLGAAVDSYKTKPVFPAKGSPDAYAAIPAEDFSAAKATVEIDNNYRTCIHGEWLTAISPCVKCTDKTGDNYLRIIVNIPPLTPCKQCGVTYGTHNDTELGHGFFTGLTAQKHVEQCGFIAIDDTIMFCDYDKGHKGGHSLRKTKIQGWT